MFSFIADTLTENLSKYLTAVVGLKCSGTILGSLSFVGRADKGADENSLRNFDSYTVSFYDTNLELLESKSVTKGVGVNLDDKKSEYGVYGWYLAKDSIPIEASFTLEGNISLYAAPNVIEITNQSELDDIRNDPLGSYILISDIALESGEDGFDEVQGWLPIGDDMDPFGGIFNGNAHKISGLWVDKTSGDDYAGLFGRVEGGRIKNLGVLIDERGVKGESYVGGIAGDIGSNSVITNAYSIGDVSGTYYAGGIVGCVGYGSEVTNTYSAGDISGTYNIGGIAGWVMSDSKVTNSYSKATVKGDTDVGGIAGSVTFSSMITNSCSAGDIRGVNNAGGISGSVEYNSWVTNSAAINQEVVGRYDTNRVVGRLESSTVSNNFALIDIRVNGFPKTDNDADSFDGADKTIGELKMQKTYANASIDGGLGWDFGNGASSPWKMDEGEGYPYLYWEDR
ncbi:MAG: hypothetical protein LBQ18_08030 [Campylobacteraceae bacterium]|jgi:hypothetical protein|nr:hypothetical protein [Campylobacteraceae bacterium]